MKTREYPTEGVKKKKKTEVNRCENLKRSDPGGIVLEKMIEENNV